MASTRPPGNQPVKPITPQQYAESRERYYKLRAELREEYQAGFDAPPEGNPTMEDLEQ